MPQFANALNPRRANSAAAVFGFGRFQPAIAAALCPTANYLLIPAEAGKFFLESLAEVLVQL